MSRIMKIPVALYLKAIQQLKEPHECLNDVEYIVVSSAPEKDDKGEFMPTNNIKLAFEKSVDHKSWNVLIQKVDEVV